MNDHYIFTHPSSLDHYTAEVFIVRCFDNRFWNVFIEFLAAKGIKDFDLESVAGGAKIFSSPEKEGDRDFMLRELEKSIRLHHTARVLLFTHHDCGAYGGFSRFEDDKEKEYEFHIAEHKNAREAIHQLFPQLPIEMYFIDAKGVIQTS